MSLPRSLSRRDSAPDLQQLNATMFSTEELDIIDSIIEKAVTSIETLKGDVSQADATIARQQRKIYDLIARLRAKSDCSDRVVELERGIESERQSYAELRTTTNSLQRKVRDLARKLKDNEKQQKDSEYEWDSERQRLFKQIDEAQKHEGTGSEKETERLKEENATLRETNNATRETVADLRKRLERLIPVLVENGLL